MRPKSTGARRFLVLAATLALAAACGGGSDNGGADTGGGNANLSDATIIMGTTDTAVHFDPGDAYDLHSWNVIYNIYDAPDHPPGGNKPVPTLAQSCDWDDTTTLQVQAGPGMKFPDGSPLTPRTSPTRSTATSRSRDQGVCSLLLVACRLRHWKERDHGSRRSTVTFNLRSRTPPGRSSSPRRRRDRAVRRLPGEELQPDDKAVGSGPYKLEKYTPGQQAVFERNDNYRGEPGEERRVIVQYYKESSALKLAIEGGDVDVAYRSLTPTDLEALKRRERRQGRRRAGHRDPLHRVQRRSSNPARTTPVRRKAIAQMIDRQAIATTSTRARSSRCTRWSRPGLPGTPTPSRTPTAHARTRRGQAGADRRRRHDAGRDRDLVHADPLRAGRPTNTPRSSASSRRAACSRSSWSPTEWDQYTSDEAKDRYRLPAGLVPGLPGRRQLPASFYARRRLPGTATTTTADRQGCSPRSWRPPTSDQAHQAFGRSRSSEPRTCR